MKLFSALSFTLIYVRSFLLVTPVSKLRLGEAPLTNVRSAELLCNLFLEEAEKKTISPSSPPSVRRALLRIDLNCYFQLKSFDPTKDVALAVSGSVYRIYLWSLVRSLN